jgi:molybdopterin biosynthesis enzyme
VVGSAGKQGSHQLHDTARANALALLPDGPPVEPGSRVEVLLLDNG